MAYLYRCHKCGQMVDRKRDGTFFEHSGCSGGGTAVIKTWPTTCGRCGKVIYADYHGRYNCKSCYGG